MQTKRAKQQLPHITMVRLWIEKYVTLTYHTVETIFELKNR